MQCLWRSIMRLLASNRVRGEFGRTREMNLLRRRQVPQTFLLADRM